MSSLKWPKRQNFFDLPEDDDEKIVKFRAAFPQEADRIINTFEKLISKHEDDATCLGRTTEGEDIFLIKETLRPGTNIFEVTIVFKVLLTDATWIGFDWSHSTTAPYVPTSIQVLEEILGSLRKKV